MSDESEAVATGRDDPVATAKCSVCGDDDHSAEWKHDPTEPPHPPPDDDELVPVCGASKQNYICVRPPDHDEGAEQVVHIGMTDRGMIVQWIEGESGVKIRPMTYEERIALEGQLPDELVEAVEGITQFAVGRLSVAPGDIVLVHSELGAEEGHYLHQALVQWSEHEGLDLHWLVLPPTQVMVLHPDDVARVVGKCTETLDGLLDEVLSCELAHGHVGRHRDPTGASWTDEMVEDAG